MNRETISDALTMLHDDILEEAEAVRGNPRRRGRRWLVWPVAAACAALAVCAAIGLLLPDLSDKSGGLPMLTITDHSKDAMGMEGYPVYDISELVSANPWREDMELSAMPVYKNPLTHDKMLVPSGFDGNKMREFALEIAENLGLDPATMTEQTDEYDARDAPELVIQGEGMRITVDHTMTAEILFEPAVSLPDGYNFTRFASLEEKTDVAEYFKQVYKDLIGMDDPQINVSGGSYDIYLRQSYDIAFFDAGDDEVEQIVHYNFNRAVFYADEAGCLHMVRVYRPDLSQKIGTYPIITVEQARELLADGSYATSAPYQMPGMEYVKKVELIYRTGEMEEYYMPYYRFYVELPEEAFAGDTKTYGAYYVPAVESAYISNMPTWGGSFN